MCVFTALGVGAAIGISETASLVGDIALGVGLVATAVSTTLGAVGQHQAAEAQARSQEYNAQVARENQKIAMNNAAMERQSGIEEARRQRVATLQAIGKQEVGLAANGVDVAYGTSLDLIEDTSELGELDALMLQYDAEKKARNYEIQANNFSNEARLADFTAANARTAGTLAVTGTVVGGIGKMASQIGSSIGFGSLGSGLGSKLGGLGGGTKISGGVVGDAITFA